MQAAASSESAEELESRTSPERTLDIYHVIGRNHMASAVFAYDPDSNVMIEADIAPAEEWQ